MQRCGETGEQKKWKHFFFLLMLTCCEKNNEKNNGTPLWRDVVRAWVGGG
jgi:hypothetical protein